MKTMNDNIIQKYLRQNGFDGLWCTVDDCGCSLSDLCPCGQRIGDILEDCKPGYFMPPGSGDADFWIGAEKQDVGLLCKLAGEVATMSNDYLPNGDTVNAATAKWAEGWVARLKIEIETEC